MVKAKAIILGAGVVRKMSYSTGAETGGRLRKNLGINQSLNKTYLCKARVGGARIAVGKALAGKKVKLKLFGPQLDDDNPELKKGLNLESAALSLEDALNNTYEVKHKSNRCYLNLPLILIGKKVKLDVVEEEN